MTGRALSFFSKVLVNSAICKLHMGSDFHVTTKEPMESPGQG